MVIDTSHTAPKRRVVEERAVHATVLRISPRTEPWISKQQLATHLGFSTRWVELRVRDGMPRERFGNRLRFHSSEVENWLRDRAA